MPLVGGVGRTIITPPQGVELTGWGYYLERTWTQIRDDLTATAVVLDDGRSPVAVVALDLMVIGADFTRRVRQMVAGHTRIPAQNITLACSHSHNAPASGGLRGVGEVDPRYEAFAARRAARATIGAWRARRPVRMRAGHGDVAGISFNRTRPGGTVDPRLTVLRVDDAATGRPLAVLVNYQAHPTVYTTLDPRAITRDVPGEVASIIERALPGCTALYLQGAAGDVNFLAEYQDPARCHEPARRLAAAALDVADASRPMDDPSLAAAGFTVDLPTRRYSKEEVLRERAEGLYRQQTGDTTGWRESIGRVMVTQPDKFIERYDGDEGRAVQALARFAVEWTAAVLRDWDTRPETLATEVQGLRIGELALLAQSAELFTPFGLDLRRRCPGELMIVGYANGRIGYLPDAHDIERRTYAAYQSPRYCNQFPFTPQSGPALVDALAAAWIRLEGSSSRSWVIHDSWNAAHHDESL